MIQQFLFWFLSEEKENINSKRYMFPYIHGALFTVTKIRKHHKCPPTDEQIKKWSINIQWSTTQPQKKNKILSFVTTWINLENIMLRKINQIAKDKYKLKLEQHTGKMYQPSGNRKLTYNF